MRFLDLCEKEVVSVEEGRFIGHVRDLEFDPVCGKSVRLSCRTGKIYGNILQGLRILYSMG